MSEIKKLYFGVKDGCLEIGVDLDKDGKPLFKLVLDVSEIPSEVIAAIAALKKD